LPALLNPSRRRIGPLTTISWHWPVVLWSSPVDVLGCMDSTTASRIGRYSLRQPAIAAAVAASSTVHTRLRWLTAPTSSWGSRPVYATNSATTSSVTGATGRPSVHPAS
jgi:hypothetical protein